MCVTPNHSLRFRRVAYEKSVKTEKCPFCFCGRSRRAKPAPKTAHKQAERKVDTKNREKDVT